MTSTLLPSIIRQATKSHTASVIFLHGLGDSGNGWAPVADQIKAQFPHIKFIFPNAPNQPVTLNGGMSMPSWYDITSLSDLEEHQDKAGMLASVQKVNKLIQNEIDIGINPNRIVIGGFSQGCVVSLLTALTSEYQFAGVVSFSGYLPIVKQVFNMATDSSKKAPILWCHGEQDEVVNYKYGLLSKEALTKNKYNVEFHSFPNMGHSACQEEIMILTQFLRRVVPENI
ncbi:Phospholipase/carboxylesterase [Neoconidiobolus thromboides FSU 785]|nr:Phospholipase/carboxylesterase [Neoconidiobolus thromboides FSU 785]